MYKSIVQNTLLVLAVLAFLNAAFYVIQGLRTPSQDIGQMIRIAYFSSAVVPTGVGGLAVFLYWITTTGYHITVNKDTKDEPPTDQPTA